MIDRCQALNDYGRQCRNKAAGDYNYYGSPDAYHRRKGWDNPRWVKIRLCRKHLKAVNKNNAGGIE